MQKNNSVKIIRKISVLNAKSLRNIATNIGSVVCGNIIGNGAIKPLKKQVCLRVIAD